MNSSILLVVLAVAGVKAGAVYTDLTKSVPLLEIGHPGPGDMPIDMFTTTSPPSNTRITQTDTIRYGESTTISAIQVTEVGESQNAKVSLVDGGVGHNFIVIEFENTPPQGYSYSVVVWARRGANWSKTTESKQMRMPTEY